MIGCMMSATGVSSDDDLMWMYCNFFDVEPSNVSDMVAEGIIDDIINEDVKVRTLAH